MNNQRHIEQLIQKFLDGRTTNAEEQELYRWFSETDVPQEWAELKAMFAWYSAGMPESEIEESVPAATRRPRTMRWAIGWSIAAAIAVAVGISLWPTKESTPPEINIYEGSYIVNSGIRYDDIAYIEEDIEQLLAKADEIERHADELLAWAEM